jgi:hypothetical protein
MDITALQWEPNHRADQLVAHIHELKPDKPWFDLSDAQAKALQKETWHYSQYAPRRTKDGFEVVDPRPGTVIRDLDAGERAVGVPESARLLAPIEFNLPDIDVRVTLRLEDSGAGGKVAGLVLYTVQLRPHQPLKEPIKELAKKTLQEIIKNYLKKYIEDIRNPPPLGQGEEHGPEPKPKPLPEKKPEEKPQQQPQPVKVPPWAAVIPVLIAAGYVAQEAAKIAMMLAPLGL